MKRSQIRRVKGYYIRPLVKGLNHRKVFIQDDADFDFEYSAFAKAVIDGKTILHSKNYEPATFDSVLSLCKKHGFKLHHSVAKTAIEAFLSSPKNKKDFLVATLDEEVRRLERLALVPPILWAVPGRHKELNRYDLKSAYLAAWKGRRLPYVCKFRVEGGVNWKDVQETAKNPEKWLLVEFKQNPLPAHVWQSRVVPSELLHLCESSIPVESMSVYLTKKIEWIDDYIDLIFEERKHSIAAKAFLNLVFGSLSKKLSKVEENQLSLPDGEYNTSKGRVEVKGDKIFHHYERDFAKRTFPALSIVSLAVTRLKMIPFFEDESCFYGDTDGFLTSKDFDGTLDTGDKIGQWKKSILFDVEILGKKSVIHSEEVLCSGIKKNAEMKLTEKEVIFTQEMKGQKVERRYTRKV